MFSNNLPALSVVLLLMSAYMLPLLAGKRLRTAQAVAVLALTLTAGFSGFLFSHVLAYGPMLYSMGGWQAPWGIELAVTPLSAFVMTVVSSIVALVVLSLPAEQENWQNRKSGWYATLVLLMTASLLGITMANDLFNLYVFSEVSTIAACALVAGKDHRNSTDAAFKYLVLGSIGSGFILFAIGLAYISTGHLNIDFAAAALLNNPPHPIVLWAMGSFFLVGFGIKAGLFPLHVWLPDAHSSGPTTASALLSGVVVKVYAVAMAQVFFGLFGAGLMSAMGLTGLLRLMAVLSILAGSAFALVQTDIKRLLAYSTVAQVGYIFLGFGIGGVLGIAAALYHVLAHGLMKAVLFLTAGKAIDVCGSREIKDFAGMGKRLPVAMSAFTLAALSMIGLPLLAGFGTKWYLFNAGLEAGIWWVPLLVIVSGLLNAAYFLPVLRSIWFSGEEERAPWRLWDMPGLPLLAAALVALGLLPGPVLKLLETAAGWLLF